MKKGGSLLETLFSIIIMLIIIVGIPSILSNTAKTSYTAYNSEIIYNLNTAINNVGIRAFDENNTLDDTYYKVLGNEDISDLQVDRKGKIQVNNNNYRKGTNDYNLSNIGLDKDETNGDTSTYDDIDDFDNYNFNLNNFKFYTNVYYSNDNIDYQQNNIIFNIDYNNKTNNHTNIKIIKIIAKDNGNKKIFMYYPAYNIGVSKYLSLEDIK